MANLPYVPVAGTLEKMLEKIKTASVPDKFSQDFVASKLAMKGGSARSIIPFIKKMGLVNPNGTPTERYSEFRNPEKSGNAIAAAMADLYSTLFEMNEKAHRLENPKLKGLIVEATGAEAGSTVVKKTLSTFNTLRKMANFENGPTAMEPIVTVDEEPPKEQTTPPYSEEFRRPSTGGEGINLSYTINLNLPATTDIEVFNAIFKSLRQHLLQE